MFRVPLVTGDSSVDEENFWNSVFLYHSSPHLINRRILGVSQLFFLQIKFSHDVYLVKNILKYSELYSQVFRLKCIDPEYINENIISNIFEQYGNKFKFEIKDLSFVKNSNEGVFVSVRILLPRNSKSKKCLEFVILDKDNNVATFSAIILTNDFAISPNFQYDIELDKAKLMKICVSDIETAELKASEWLSDVLFPKLIAWTEKKDPNSPVQKSLSLIPVDKYCNLYQELKLKYGENIVKNWPENTDPLKFVYEDVAIASYLLILWQSTSNTKQKFVDLGCGNGLLVYILSQEGHEGYGIDVRPRKIWKMYPETTHLKIETIIPSSSYLFPNTDWIIGNHSDELTPWIPVIAARSSQKCNFFLLPCCSYEFNGRKYQRNDSSQSQYHEYLNYVKKISNTCGYTTEMDRLRIPSTKRICLVGRQRTTNDFESTDKDITELINSRCSGTDVNDKSGNWVNNYEARSNVETVRNCTKLDKSLTESIVNRAVTHLLSFQNNITTSLGKTWNAGGTVPLPELVKIIPKEDLKELKKECGGLQTLLKNNHYIFLVKNGTVQIRIPIVKPQKFAKKRECWFYKYHPDGCTLDADSCSYLHC